MQTNTVALSIVKGLAFSTILEYTENSKRVFTDFTNWQFKAQFRSAKNTAGTLQATIVPVAVGLGQLRLSLTDSQTAKFTGTSAFYDILALSPSGTPEKMFEGQVTLNETVSIWESTPPVTSVSPAAGAYNANQSIVLSVNEVGAKIHYTLDGSVPTADSPLYSAPIPVSTTTTVKFFAIDMAGNVETPQTAVFTIDKVAPVTSCSVAADASIATTDSITLTANETATTYYTTNGSAPTTGSTQYTGPFTLPAGNYTLRFFSVDTAGNAEAAKSVANITVA